MKLLSIIILIAFGFACIELYRANRHNTRHNARIKRIRAAEERIKIEFVNDEMECEKQLALLFDSEGMAEQARTHRLRALRIMRDQSSASAAQQVFEMPPSAAPEKTAEQERRERLRELGKKKRKEVLASYDSRKKITTERGTVMYENVKGGCTEIEFEI